MEPIDNRTRSDAHASRGGHDLPPRGTVHRSARSHINFAGKNGVKGVRHPAKGRVLTPPGVRDLHGERSANDSHRQRDGLNRLGQKLVPVSKTIQNIPDYGRIQLFRHCLKTQFVG